VGGLDGCKDGLEFLKKSPPTEWQVPYCGVHPVAVAIFDRRFAAGGVLDSSISSHSKW
jgi:hypothetical protein